MIAPQNSSDKLPDMFQPSTYRMREAVTALKLNNFNDQAEVQFDIINLAVGNTFNNQIANLGGGVGDINKLTPTTPILVGTMPKMFQASNTYLNKIPITGITYVGGVLTFTLNGTLDNARHVRGSGAPATVINVLLVKEVDNVITAVYPGTLNTLTSYAGGPDITVLTAGSDLDTGAISATHLLALNVSVADALSQAMANIGAMDFASASGFMKSDNSAIDTVPAAAGHTVTQEATYVEDKLFTVRWHAKLQKAASHITSPSPNYVWHVSTTDHDWAAGSQPEGTTAMSYMDYASSLGTPPTTLDKVVAYKGAPIMRGSTQLEPTITLTSSTLSISIPIADLLAVTANDYIDVYFPMLIPYRLLQSTSMDYTSEDYQLHDFVNTVIGVNYGYSASGTQPSTIDNRLVGAEDQLLVLKTQLNNSMRCDATVNTTGSSLLAGFSKLSNSTPSNITGLPFRRPMNTVGDPAAPLTVAQYIDPSLNADGDIHTNQYTVGLLGGEHNSPGTQPVIVPAFNSLIGIGARAARIIGDVILDQGATLENIEVQGTIKTGICHSFYESLTSNLKYAFIEMWDHNIAPTTPTLFQGAWATKGYGTNVLGESRWLATYYNYTGVTTLAGVSTDPVSPFSRSVILNGHDTSTSPDATICLDSIGIVGSTSVVNTLYSRWYLPECSLGVDRMAGGCGFSTGTGLGPTSYGIYLCISTDANSKPRWGIMVFKASTVNMKLGSNALYDPTAGTYANGVVLGLPWAHNWIPGAYAVSAGTQTATIDNFIDTKLVWNPTTGQSWGYVRSAKLGTGYMGGDYYKVVDVNDANNNPYSAAYQLTATEMNNSIHASLGIHTTNNLRCSRLVVATANNLAADPLTKLDLTPATKLLTPPAIINCDIYASTGVRAPSNTFQTLLSDCRFTGTNTEAVGSTIDKINCYKRSARKDSYVPDRSSSETIYNLVNPL